MELGEVAFSEIWGHKLSRRERIFWLIVGAVFVVGFVFLIPAYSQVCEQGKAANQQQCPSYHIARIAIWQIAEFLDLHNWLVTALFAGLVTLFTWRLWQATIELRISTDKLWKAGDDQLSQIKRSADISERTLVGIERPWLFVNLHPHLGGEFSEHKIPFALFDISNHGRMPGIIEGCWITLGGGDLKPDSPLLRDEFHGAIGPNEKMGNRTVDCPDGREYELMVDLGDEKTNHPTPRIGGDEEFFFYIKLNYTDIEGTPHLSRFCWRYDRGMDYWVKFDSEEYNQIT